MKYVPLVLIILMVIFMIRVGIESDERQAQNLYDRGKYSDIVTKYPDLPIAENARARLREALTADSLAKVERSRLVIKMQRYETEFPVYVSYLRSLTKQLTERNERIAAIPLTDLYQLSLTRTFQSQAENYSNRIQRELDTRKSKWLELGVPWYSSSHARILEAIERLAIIEKMVYMTYVLFNPGALRNFGFDYLAMEAATGIANTRRELENSLWELDQIVEVFQGEMKSNSLRGSIDVIPDNPLSEAIDFMMGMSWEDRLPDSLFEISIDHGTDHIYYFTKKEPKKFGSIELDEIYYVEVGASGLSGIEAVGSTENQRDALIEALDAQYGPSVSPNPNYRSGADIHMKWILEDKHAWAEIRWWNDGLPDGTKLGFNVQQLH